MQLLKFVKIGNSVGLVIPKESRRDMRVKEGDYVYLIETPDGWRITPYDPVLQAQFGVAAFAADRHRNVLRALSD